MVFFVRSRIARWASRSFARFLASWSGVRVATPRELAEVLLRFLEAWLGDPGVSEGTGDAVADWPKSDCILVACIWKSESVE
jgi:hypothetical protein